MKRVKRIVVGHDLRGGGDAALESAIVLAAKCEAKLKLVHVVEFHHFHRKIAHPMASKQGREEIIAKAGVKLEAVAASREFGQLWVEFDVHMGNHLLRSSLLAAHGKQT